MENAKFARVKKAIIGEINFLDRSISDQKIYALAVSEFRGDTAMADEWMLSKYGGYSVGILNSIKAKINYQNSVGDQRAEVF